MKYLCLIYEAETLYVTMSREEGQAMMAEYGTFTQEVIAGGQYIAGEALKPVNTATTVRIRNGQLSVTDGPFAETKEQLGGFYLIEAPDLTDALRIAGRIPSAKTGSIEVRPIQVFN
ncbi:MAG TPA: YciI family protein [Fibrobacteria bacterium]|nr:YciI family protein [Fibrobacteria bacterium]